MKLLWFTWKDLSHPQAGGAEVVNEELAKRLAASGHEVIFVVGGYKNAVPKETSKYGYEIIRVGGRYTVYHKARMYYKKNFQGWADLIIDEVNTIPFFTKLYAKEPTIMFAHMLCRNIWFYQLPLPFSLVGYVAEPIYMRRLNDRKVITVSNSTKLDLESVGFQTKNIKIISEGIQLEPLAKLPPESTKAKQPTLLSLGQIRPMKRTLQQIEAFEFAKQQLPELKLIIAGDASGRYGREVLQAIKHSPYASDISYHGAVSKSEKLQLLQQAHVILQTSVKEGWGLTVTEAASQGTPAAVYNVDGLRDSVHHNQTGLITKQNNPQQLAATIVTLLTNPARYTAMRQEAWEWSKLINFDESYLDFIQAITL